MYLEMLMNCGGVPPCSGQGRDDATAKVDAVDGGGGAPEASVVPRKEKNRQG